MNKTLFGDKKYFYHLFNSKFINDNYLMLDISDAVYKEQKHDRMLEYLNDIIALTSNSYHNRRVCIFK